MLLGCGATLGLVLSIMCAGISWLVVEEWRDPSGKVFVETDDGWVGLPLPEVLSTPPTAPAVDLSQFEPELAQTVAIPAIGLSADVVLMETTAPAFPAAGWLYGTTAPGTAGNIVLYGARTGPNQVFGRLEEVQPGDEVIVATRDVGYVYRVTSIEEVTPDRTDLLLPTVDAVVTLLTDAGEWDPKLNAYTLRLVVRGALLTARPWPPSVSPTP